MSLQPGEVPAVIRPGEVVVSEPIMDRGNFDPNDPPGVRRPGKVRVIAEGVEFVVRRVNP